MKLPEPLKNVIITYKKDGHIITKRAFYSKTFKNFAIPSHWRYFNGDLLPHGFGGDRVNPDKIIKWEYIKE